MNRKVTVVGGGNVGATLAQRLAQRALFHGSLRMAHRAANLVRPAPHAAVLLEQHRNCGRPARVIKSGPRRGNP